MKIKDERLLHRYRVLSLANRVQVDQILKRYLDACAKAGVEPEAEVTLREAMDMVISGKWEPDREWERPDARWHYDHYTSPIKEAM